jgi:hypothetical protein
MTVMEVRASEILQQKNVFAAKCHKDDETHQFHQMITLLREGRATIEMEPQFLALKRNEILILMSCIQAGTSSSLAS